jgi:hypothetical protein
MVIDTVAIFPCHISLLVPSIRSGGSNGRGSRGTWKVSQTFARSLGSVKPLAALELALVDMGSVFSGVIRSRIIVDTVAIGPLYTGFGVPNIGAVHAKRRGSRRTGQFGKTGTACLTGEIGFAAGEFSGVTWAVVGVFRGCGTPSGLVIIGGPRIVQHSKVALCSSTKSSSRDTVETDGRETDGGDFHRR